MRNPIACFLVLLLLYQCSSTTGKSTRTRRLPNVITQEEIELSMANRPMRTAFDVIQYLRPNFLRMRGTTSGIVEGQATPVVYVNLVRFGDVQSLNNIYVEQVKEIRYMPATDATTRFGIGHSAGAILVTLK